MGVHPIAAALPSNAQSQTQPSLRQTNVLFTPPILSICSVTSREGDPLMHTHLGPSLITSKPSRPWPPTSSPSAASRPGCLAGCAAAISLPGAGWVGGGHPAGQPGPRSRAEAAPAPAAGASAGWRPTLILVLPTGRWCGPWPGSGAPPAWRLRPTGPAMSWRRWARCLGRPGVGGPGARPRPRSSSSGAATRSRIRTGPSVPSRATRLSGPTGSGRAPRSSGSGLSSAPPTAPTTASRPAGATAIRDLVSSVAGAARSGPPASPH
jgi:hypothetical protein